MNYRQHGRNRGTGNGKYRVEGERAQLGKNLLYRKFDPQPSCKKLGMAFLPVIPALRTGASEH